MENDADNNIARLIPLIRTNTNGSSAKKRFGKNVGQKIRRAFKRFGRSVRNADVSGTVTTGKMGATNMSQISSLF